MYYHVSHKRQIRRIATDIHLLPKEWDATTQRIVSSHSEQKRLQHRLDSDMATLLRIVHDLELRRLEFSTDDIVSRFQTPARHVSVMAFFHEQIAFLTDCNRLGTAMNYSRAAHTLTTFLSGRDLRFSELTSCFVEEYSDYLLRKGMVRNSLSFHMRILRAVYNKSVRRGYAEQTYPFRDVYTGVDRTRKRAVKENVLQRLIHLDLDSCSSLSFARDIFLFSFYTRGMAFIDIAYLRKSDIQGGIIRYARHKTGQELSICVEPCIQTIIDHYADASTPYIFPILKDEHPTACYHRYKRAIRLYNSRLERLSKLMGLEQRLSSYTSRHTWASMAHNHNIPISVISAGLGHTSERTTQIYLTSLENSLIDNANRTILELLNRPQSD